MDVFTGVPDGFASIGTDHGIMPLQEWMTTLDDIEAPGDSQWLAQELFQGLVGDSTFAMQ